MQEMFLVGSSEDIADIFGGQRHRVILCSGLLEGGSADYIRQGNIEAEVAQAEFHAYAFQPIFASFSPVDISSTEDIFSEHAVTFFSDRLDVA
jgi:hypothetical protein